MSFQLTTALSQWSVIADEELQDSLLPKEEVFDKQCLAFLVGSKSAMSDSKPKKDNHDFIAMIYFAGILYTTIGCVEAFSLHPALLVLRSCSLEYFRARKVVKSECKNEAKVRK